MNSALTTRATTPSRRTITSLAISGLILVASGGSAVDPPPELD